MFGDQPVADIIGESAQNVTSFEPTPGRQGQAFEADHRVAAPVGEPMVAGDDCAHFVTAAWARAASSKRPAGVITN